MTSIYSTNDFDIFDPTTVSGICYEAGGVPIGARQHLVTFAVGNCDGSFIADAATGFLSTSRLIVEELPHCKGCGHAQDIVRVWGCGHAQATCTWVGHIT